MSSKVGMLGEKIEVGDLLFYIFLLVFTVIIYFVTVTFLRKIAIRNTQKNSIRGSIFRFVSGALIYLSMIPFASAFFYFGHVFYDRKVPEVEMFGVELGAKRQDVFFKLGVPDVPRDYDTFVKGDVASSLGSWDVYDCPTSRNYGNLSIRYKSDFVDNIAISGNCNVKLKGISIGSNIENVLLRFGDPRPENITTSPDGAIRVFRYPDVNVMVTLEKQKVTGIDLIGGYEKYVSALVHFRNFSVDQIRKSHESDPRYGKEFIR